MTEHKQTVKHECERASEAAHTVEEAVAEGEFFAGSQACDELITAALRLRAYLEAAEDEGEGQTERVVVIRGPVVSQSPLTGEYHYFPYYRTAGKGMKVMGYRDDVTDPVKRLIENKITNFLAYCHETYNLDLWDPDPVKEDDGESYIHGVAEKTGYDYINELIGEWRSDA